MRLENKVAIVTGASRGLGKATAFALADEGATVVVASRTEETGGRLPGTIHQTVQEIESKGGKALAVRADMGNAEEVENLLEKTLNDLGGVDIVIHNAAAVAIGRVVETAMRRWDLVWNVNLRATGALVTGAYPSMKERGGGHIIIVTQIAAPGGGPGFNPIYRLAKNVAGELIPIIAEEVKDEGISINGIWPGSQRDTIGGRMARGGDKAPRGLDPRIFSDAVVELVTRAPGTTTGQLFTDEEVLRQTGVSDFSIYEPKTEQAEF